MSTKITLDDPTGSDHWIADLGIWVKQGESVVIDNPATVASLLQNPIWKGKKPNQATIDKHLTDETVTTEGGKTGDAGTPSEEPAAERSEGDK